MAGCNAHFPPHGELTRYVRRGDYGRIRSFAAEAALTLTTERDLTIPSTFAVHAISSAFASINRPSAALEVNARTTYFLNHLASRLAWQVPEEALSEGPDPHDFALAARKRAALIARAIGNPTAWMNMKFHTLADKLMLRKRVTEIIDGEPTLNPNLTGDLRRTNQQLFSELRRLRRYSIKSAVHTEGGSAWSIQDMSEAYEQVLAAMIDDRSSAIQAELHQPRMVMMAVERSADIEDLVVPLITTENMRPNYDAFDHQVWMDEQGELYGDWNGTVPLHPLYKAARKPANYEALRQFLLQKYFDLTVPITIVKKVNAETRRELGTESPGQGREQGIIYINLLLPRIRILREYQTPEELEVLDIQENEAMLAAMSPTRRQRFHTREMHPRKLPPGHRPHPDKIAEAERLGIVLEPGETFVKKHDRGDRSLGEVLHRAKKRKTGDPAED